MLCTWITLMHAQGSLLALPCSHGNALSRSCKSCPVSTSQSVTTEAMLLPFFWSQIFPEVSQIFFYNKKSLPFFSSSTDRIGRISNGYVSIPPPALQGVPLQVTAPLTWRPNHWMGSWKPLMWKMDSFSFSSQDPNPPLHYQGAGYSVMPQRHLILTHNQYSQLYPTQSVGSSTSDLHFHWRGKCRNTFFPLHLHSRTLLKVFYFV